MVREIYEVLSPGEFVETFQLAAPGGEYQTYSRNHLGRNWRAANQRVSVCENALSAPLYRRLGNNFVANVKPSKQQSVPRHRRLGSLRWSRDLVPLCTHTVVKKSPTND